SKASGTSKEMEIKLTNVARASLEELLEDYRDYLRVRDLAMWEKNSKEAQYVRTLGNAMLGVVILFPAGFIFSEEVRRLPPALQSPLFIPHVASYVAGYVLMARAALIALPLLRRGGDAGEMRAADLAARQTAAAGFTLLTSGLLLGAVWGKVCWGNYWHFDPKETWSLATWLVYGGYFHYRLKHGMRSRRAAAALLWAGLLFVILTLTWINLSRIFAGLHNYA
ncbi:MAG: cytochrome c biogenesis protein CcsA, partial [Kiritimatiellae bacterium]|nr:cytochrome c biogenesis protein CcsA [Kiritimatiellia bacterium]